MIKVKVCDVCDVCVHGHFLITKFYEEKSWCRTSKHVVLRLYVITSKYCSTNDTWRFWKIRHVVVSLHLFTDQI